MGYELMSFVATLADFGMHVRFECRGLIDEMSFRTLMPDMNKDKSRPHQATPECHYNQPKCLTNQENKSHYFSVPQRSISPTIYPSQPTSLSCPAPSPILDSKVKHLLQGIQNNLYPIRPHKMKPFIPVSHIITICLGFQAPIVHAENLLTLHTLVELEMVVAEVVRGLEALVEDFACEVLAWRDHLLWSGIMNGSDLHVGRSNRSNINFAPPS